MTERQLAKLYKEVHNIMRNEDGLQPQESFTELLKYLFLKLHSEYSEYSLSELSAKELNKLLLELINNDNGWITKTWTKKKFELSSDCLVNVNEKLSVIMFSEIDFDIKSQAIQEFLSPQLRKGLGIFLTPNPIVKSIIDYVSPEEEATIIDPACGSGTFLLECAKISKSYNLVGTDKNPRMLLLAYLNLTASKDLKFKCSLEDSLFSSNSLLDNQQYDYVFTNPPFGVNLDSRSNDFTLYETCKGEDGYQLKKQSSEVVFIEKCMRLLKEGGTLAIVIPKGIATNNSLSNARNALSKYGYVYSIFSLPPETFSSTGTQTTTIVMFIKKYKSNEDINDIINLKIANIKNVGYDSTGRYREGSELPDLINLMNVSYDSKKSNIDTVEIKKVDTFKLLTDIFVMKNNKEGDTVLGDLAECIHTGRTPSRSLYSDEGYFLIKVGNLTGNGINWESRDRNFINIDEISKRQKSSKSLIVQKGDILLTSSAHSSVYIAKKSDIIDEIPDWINNHVSFVGEVMLVRPKKGVNPYKVLAYLKIPSVVYEIQNMVRGQTAHLHSRDLENLSIDEKIFNSKRLLSIAKILEKQSKVSNQLNSINNKINSSLLKLT